MSNIYDDDYDYVDEANDDSSKLYNNEASFLELFRNTFPEMNIDYYKYMLYVIYCIFNKPDKLDQLLKKYKEDKKINDDGNDYTTYRHKLLDNIPESDVKSYTNKINLKRICYAYIINNTKLNYEDFSYLFILSEYINSKDDIKKTIELEGDYKEVYNVLEKNYKSMFGDDDDDYNESRPYNNDDSKPYNNDDNYDYNDTQTKEKPNFFDTYKIQKPNERSYPEDIYEYIFMKYIVTFNYQDAIGESVNNIFTFNNDMYNIEIGIYYNLCDNVITKYDNKIKSDDENSCDIREITLKPDIVDNIITIINDYLEKAKINGNLGKYKHTLLHIRKLFNNSFRKAYIDNKPGVVINDSILDRLSKKITKLKNEYPEIYEELKKEMIKEGEGNLSIDYSKNFIIYKIIHKNHISVMIADKINKNLEIMDSSYLYENTIKNQLFKLFFLNPELCSYNIINVIPVHLQGPYIITYTDKFCQLWVEYYIHWRIVMEKSWYEFSEIMLFTTMFIRNNNQMEILKSFLIKISGDGAMYNCIGLMNSYPYILAYFNIIKDSIGDDKTRDTVNLVMTEYLDNLYTNYPYIFYDVASYITGKYITYNSSNSNELKNKIIELLKNPLSLDIKYLVNDEKKLIDNKKDKLVQTGGSRILKELIQAKPTLNKDEYEIEISNNILKEFSEILNLFEKYYKDNNTTLLTKTTLLPKTTLIKKSKIRGWYVENHKQPAPSEEILKKNYVIITSKQSIPTTVSQGSSSGNKSTLTLSLGPSLHNKYYKQKYLKYKQKYLMLKNNI
jgi:hypothetical protein